MPRLHSPALPPELIAQVILDAVESLAEAERNDSKLRHHVVPFLLSLLTTNSCLSAIASHLLFTHALITPIMGDAYIEAVKETGRGSRVKSIRVMADQLDDDLRGWEGGAGGAVGVLLSKLAMQLPNLKELECLGCIPEWDYWPSTGAPTQLDRIFFSRQIDTEERPRAPLPTAISSHAITFQTLRFGPASRAQKDLGRLLPFFESTLDLTLIADCRGEIHTTLGLNGMPVGVTSLRLESQNGLMDTDYGSWKNFPFLNHLTTPYQALAPDPSYLSPRHEQLVASLPRAPPKMGDPLPTCLTSLEIIYTSGGGSDLRLSDLEARVVYAIKQLPALERVVLPAGWWKARIVKELCEERGITYLQIPSC